MGSPIGDIIAAAAGGLRGYGQATEDEEARARQAKLDELNEQYRQDNLDRLRDATNEQRMTRMTGIHERATKALIDHYGKQGVDIDPTKADAFESYKALPTVAPTDMYDPTGGAANAIAGAVTGAGNAGRQVGSNISKYAMDALVQSAGQKGAIVPMADGYGYAHNIDAAKQAAAESTAADRNQARLDQIREAAALRATMMATSPAAQAKAMKHEADLNTAEGAYNTPQYGVDAEAGNRIFANMRAAHPQMDAREIMLAILNARTLHQKTVQTAARIGGANARTTGANLKNDIMQGKDPSAKLQGVPTAGAPAAALPRAVQPEGDAGLNVGPGPSQVDAPEEPAEATPTRLPHDVDQYDAMVAKFGQARVTKRYGSRKQYMDPSAK